MTKKAMVIIIRELINGINKVRVEYKDYIENTYKKYSNASSNLLGYKCDATDRDTIKFYEIEEMTDSKLYRTYDNMDMQITIDCLTHLLESCKRQLEVRQWEIQQHLDNKSIKEAEKVEIIECYVPKFQATSLKEDNLNKLIKYDGNNQYLKLLSHFINNTIKEYHSRLKDYYYLFDNLESINNKYKDNVNQFYADYNITLNDFSLYHNMYNNLKMLSKIDINNILVSFDKEITLDKLIKNADYQLLTPEELNYIRMYLFDNSFKKESMCTLEEQNNILKNYSHYDKSIKNIKCIA